MGFRDKTRRVGIISTDALYHKAGDLGSKPSNNGDAVLDGNGVGEDYPSVAQVQEAINKANLLPVFLVTSNVKSSYEDLVSQLGVGAVISLNADSSNLVAALKEALEVVNQNLTLVVLNDEYDYVESVKPERFKDVTPGSEITTYVNFKYSGTGSDENVTLRAIGLGDLVIDVVIPVDVES